MQVAKFHVNYIILLIFDVISNHLPGTCGPFNSHAPSLCLKIQSEICENIGGCHTDLNLSLMSSFRIKVTTK